MTKPTETLVEFPRQSARDVLTEVLRTGARQLLATAIEAEVDEYVAARAHDYAAEDRLGAGISRVVQARLGGAARCLRLGRRRLRQRPARGHGQQTAMYFGAHRRNPGEDEGVDRDHGRRV